MAGQLSDTSGDDSFQAFIDHLLSRCSFPPVQADVVCAVSGGPDSVALLVLAVAVGCRATAVHVDHGLRPESASEAELVRRIAEQFGADFVSETVNVDPGPNLEARARKARYGVLPADAMLGHTVDDQAETMLLNLLRGAGPSGMAAMAYDARRPILQLRRSETHELCTRLGLDVVTDPTNTDPAFRRNRIRNELLPLIDDIADRDVAPLLASQAPLFGEQAALLGALAGVIDPTDCAALRDAHPVLAQVRIRDWLRTETSMEHPVDHASVQRVLDVVHGIHKGTEVVGGWRVSRTSGRLRVSPPLGD